MFRFLVESFTHPLGILCHLIWFMIVVWLAIKVFNRLFPPQPPVPPAV